MTSKIDTNQALNIDLPETSSFSSVLIENQEMIYLYESGKLRYGDISVDIESSETLISFISSQIPKSELITLAIEKRAYHEWVLQLMDDLQLSGYQNIQIRTYQE